MEFLPEDEDLTELAHALSLLSDLQVDYWKREVIVECVDNPDYPSTVSLVLKDCKEISYQAFEAEYWEENEKGMVKGADLIGLIFEAIGGQKFLFITTDLFEVKIAYGQIGVSRKKE
jgi:hypothetical protein